MYDTLYSESAVRLLTGHDDDSVRLYRGHSGDSAEPAAWHFVQEAAAAARDMRAIAERGVGLLG